VQKLPNGTGKSSRRHSGGAAFEGNAEPGRGAKLGHYASVWRHVFAIFVSRAAEHCDLFLTLFDARVLCDDPHATGVGFGLAADATALGLQVDLSRGLPRCCKANKCRQNTRKEIRKGQHLHNPPPSHDPTGGSDGKQANNEKSL